jgi:hypothetical protein
MKWKRVMGGYFKAMQNQRAGKVANFRKVRKN